MKTNKKLSQITESEIFTTPAVSHEGKALSFSNHFFQIMLFYTRTKDLPATTINSETIPQINCVKYTWVLLTQ